jgi:hypothetical protein
MAETIKVHYLFRDPVRLQKSRARSNYLTRDGRVQIARRLVEKGNRRHVSQCRHR